MEDVRLVSNYACDIPESSLVMLYAFLILKNHIEL